MSLPARRRGNDAPAGEHMARRPRKRLSGREQWEAFKKGYPEALKLARPHRAMLLMGMGLLLVNRLASLVLPQAPRLIIDEAIPKGNMALLYQVLGAVVAAAFVQGIASFLMTQTISKAGQRLIRDLRMKLHEHVVHLPLRYFDAHRSGEVAARVMSDVEGVRNLIGTGIVELMNGLLTAAFVGAILLWMNWKLTLMAVAFLGLFGIVVVRAFMHLRPIFEERQETNAQVHGRLIESFGGVRVVKAYTTEEREASVFRQGVDRLLGTIMRTINTIAFLALSTSSLIGILGAIVLFFASQQIMSGEMTPGELITYCFYLVLLVGPVAGAVGVSSSLSEAFAGLDRMREVLSQPREDAGEEGRAPLGEIEGRIALEDVTFEYDEGKPVLHGVSFEGAPGTVTALVGPSGSGKSTIMGLIAGFYAPRTGRVLVDGRDLATVRLADYRSRLGVVLQDNFLFDGTVRENVLYSRPAATQDQLEEAARLAHCTEFITALPNGWDTVIGERGVKLSGGQRQRLAIARAILANPRILILDEATSALDSESEALIQAGLAELMRGRTTFVIAHRLSTIRGATRILVVEGGRVVESGAHGELLARRGRYFEMYTLQHGLDGLLATGEASAAGATAGEDEPPDPLAPAPGLGSIIG